MMAREYIKVYFSYLDLINGLSDNERGRLFTYCLIYAQYHIVPEIKGNEKDAFEAIKKDIDHDDYIDAGRLIYGSVGEFHPNWKGGITSQNQVGRNSARYQKWRMSVFERDNYTCQVCGNRGGTLNAHHLIKWSEDKRKRYDVDNGMTLCIKCHNAMHRRK